MNLILPVLFIFFGIFFIVISKSQRNYKKLVENNGKAFADKVNKYLKMCGYAALICSILWLLFSSVSI
jgi:hypothetical protein